MLELRFHGPAAVVTLHRPEALNALSFALIDRLAQAFDEVGRSAARVLVVTGSGTKAFCAGADIKELQGRDLGRERAGAERGQQVFAMLDRLPQASIALVNGYAFGGGMELALACTFRLATAGAKFGLPEVKLGLIPGYGGTQRLPRLVGSARALDMILTGRTVDAREALAIGLVQRVLDPGGDPLEAALDYGESFCRFGLLAQRLAREAVLRAADLPLHEGLRMEADLSTLAYRTADAAEGMQAFVDKRPARFEDH